MVQHPKISIITATYNAENTLEKSILSVLQQTYKNIEYIVIDGMSNDKTVEIIKSYNEHIDYFVSEKDDGIYDAWNKGLKKATGNWVMFIGADDFLSPNAVEQYINYINENPEYDMITSKACLVDENGMALRIIGKPYHKKQIRHYMQIIHSGSITKRKIFDKYGCFDSIFSIVADYEFVLRVCKKINIGFFNQITIKFSTGGVSNRNLMPIIQTLRLKNKYFKNKFVNYIDFLIAVAKFKIKFVCC